MTLRRISFFDGFQSETTPVTVVIADREFRVGSGVPSNGLGNDTDNYLDYSTGNIYLKSAGTWSLTGTIDLQSVGGDFTVNGNLDVQGTIDSTDDITSGGNVSSTTEISSGSDLIAAGNLDINGTGESNIAGNLTVEGDLTINGTTTTVNTDTLDVEDANITVNKNGDQSTADSNDAGFTVEMSDATDATIHYDSTSTTKFKVGEVGSTVDVADISTAQTFTNKTLEQVQKLTSKEDTEANLITYAATASNGEYVYATDSKKYFGIEDGTLVEFGSGSGQGGINYITNFGAEDDTDGWVTYADAAQEIPEDSLGGSPVVTFTRSETDPLRDEASFVFTKDASDRQGQGVAYIFDIDNADKAKWLNISLDYSVTDDYEDADIRFYVRDNTNATIIRLSNEDLLAIGSSLSGTFRSGFQTAVDSTNYSLIMHVATTNALAYDVKIDNVRVGPINTSSTGSFISGAEEDTPLTPVGTWNNTTYSAKYIRFGNQALIRFTLDITGVPSGGSLVFVNGSGTGGLTIDTSKFDFGNSGRNSVGTGEAIDISTGTSHSLTATIQPSGNLLIANTNQDTGAANFNPTQPFSFATGDGITFEITVPIVGWETGVSPNEVVSGRSLTVDVNSNLGQVITANVTPIPFSTTVKDEGGSWNGSEFTAQESGNYHFSGGVFFTTTGFRAIDTYIDTGSGYTYSRRGGAATNDNVHPISVLIPLNKGDKMHFRSTQTATLSPSPVLHTLTAEKNNSLNAQMSPTDTVAASYTSDSGQSVPHADAVNGKIEFEDEDYDTHNAYNTTTGKYKIPITGKYAISATARTGTPVASSIGVLIVYVNDVPLRDGPVIRNTSDVISGTVTCYLDLKAGDEVDIRMFQANNLTTAQNLNTASQTNHFNIIKVGN